MTKIEILRRKKYRYLFIDDCLWMWDTPQEIKLQKKLAQKAFGDVLVVGYGFGILSGFLSKNSKIKSVVTVEKYKEVIKKMKTFGKINGKIIVSDFYKLPEKQKFDCIIGDIWPDIDEEFLKDYVKFKKKAQKILKKNGKILAWGKDYFEFGAGKIQSFVGK